MTTSVRLHRRTCAFERQDVGNYDSYVRFCRNCHGADAHGGRVGESITGESDELHEAVREGHGGDRYADRTEYMPAWTTAELSDVEVALVADYLATLPPGPDNDDDD
jgi:mono/diheme cytochrome c family protein